VGSGTALPEGISPYFVKFFGNLQTDIKKMGMAVSTEFMRTIQPAMDNK